MSDAKKKILHIEDDKNVQLLVRMILERAGYAVSTAVDAMQGLMLARQLNPDLVVLDIMMPAGGGASVHERIRQLSGSSAVPILIYSATDPSDIAKKVPADPLTTILQKPAPPAVIVAAVERLFSARVVNWASFAVCEPDAFAAAARGINTAEGLGDRLRVAAFAELQAREAFRWAADTLLDASVPQRAAWRRIADDENRHLEMLLGRMAELGVKPDARLVSDRLWRSLRACKTTREFVAFMKTAEERGRAAEESFRRQFAERDPVTAAIFGKIADDEAEHIALAASF